MKVFLRMCSLANTSINQVARVEKESFQFAFAKNSLQLAVSDERNEHREQEQCENENAIQRASTKIAYALLEGFPVVQANGGFF